MSECPEKMLLAAYERGELVDTAARPVERHLRVCGICRAVMDELRAADPDGQMLHKVFSGTGETPLTGVSPDGPSDGDSAVSQDVAESDQSSASDSERSSGSSGATPVGGSSGRSAPRLTGPPAPSDWRVPDYERVQLCGEGSYGAVWAVRDRVGVYRALKLIDLDRLERAKIRCHELPALEAYCRNVSRHPHLVTVFHVGQVENCLYYTMELADDQGRHGPVRDDFPQNYRPLTLTTLINVGRLTVDVSMELARRLLRGAARLHELDLIHRDIKPSNIIFVDRQPKLADIGVLTAEGQRRRIVGTPKYMPPDRIMNKTADTFAVGMVLHEMLMGKDHASFPELPDEDPWIGAKWSLERTAKLLKRACADNAADRYPTATAMLDDLEACAELSTGSLFDELLEDPSPPAGSMPLLIDLGFAFADRLPWILGAIVVLYLIYKWA